jgi:hypothetical protein
VGPASFHLTSSSAAQVRYAFLAGLLVCIALIPVNRLIAGAIQSASTRMMAAKDARVAAVRELVAHMRLVKMLAWEGLFVRKVGRQAVVCQAVQAVVCQAVQAVVCQAVQALCRLRPDMLHQHARLCWQDGHALQCGVSSGWSCTFVCPGSWNLVLLPAAHSRAFIASCIHV